MDAIDAAAIDFSTNPPRVVATRSYALPEEYKDTYLKYIHATNCDFMALGQLDIYTGELFAKAILELLSKNNIDKSKVSAIGSHGQTLWHAPQVAKPFSIQLGDPNTIAYLTGITTIADFRMADIAAGGQGAPLAPAFHQAIFSNACEPRCVVNIGGFSNISVLAKNTWLGFDSGPGNCLMDYWANKYFNCKYDLDGQIAATGAVNEPLLQNMLKDPYFKLNAPKSTGHEYFNPHWLEKYLIDAKTNFDAQDIMATLLHLTANSISIAIKNYAPAESSIFICGGGIKNKALIKQLSINLEREIYSTTSLGIEPQWMEAALFAWLAKQRFTCQAIDLSRITGSTKPVILGGIYAV